MYIIPVTLSFIIISVIVLKLESDLKIIPIALAICITITAIIIGIDYTISTIDSEVWSGRITNVYHKEEWDEYHPPRTEEYTETYTNSKGETKTRTKTKTIPGYWEHHYAINEVTTSDNGTFSVSTTPDGKKLNDNFVNNTKELEQYYPINKPTASVHSYRNKVQSSYSIYKHSEIDLDKYPNLPEYPNDVNNYVSIDRIVGDVPQKEKALETLAEINSQLNKSVPDIDDPEKMRSYKQVNLIFVNLGDVSEDYGFALQDKWEGGNKNDFVVAFGTDSNNEITWVYPFSWSETEILKINIRDYMLNQENIKDFTTVISDVSKMVEEQFIRKEFADFDYLSIEVSTPATIIIWILNMVIIGFVLIIAVGINDNNYKKNKYNNIRY